MSKSESRIPSPARSQGAITPRRPRTRRTLSMASPARSDASVRLSSVVDKFINNDKFTMSPMKRRSVLPDDTEIEAPRRASWWKRLEGSSRDVLEALDTNKMPDDLLMEEYEFEVEKDKQNQTVPESSDNESVASIVVPQRRLFNQKKQPQAKFGEIMGSRKSLGRTKIEDESIEDAPKNLFNKGPRNKPVFPAALLNSTNKTINKTVEPETNKQTRPNLFGQAGNKRKNMFTDFVLSESEEDSEVQHKVFGFKNKRMSLGTRNRRMPSLTPSMTTEIDIDDWNLLPSSTMIGAPEVSRIITDKDIEFAEEENKDKTLTEEDPSLDLETDTVNKPKNIQNKSQHQTKLTESIIHNEDNDKTLTNEDIEMDDANKHQDVKDNNVSKQENKTQNLSKSARVEDKTLQNKSSRRTNNEEVIGDISVEQEVGKVVTNHQLLENEPSVEEAMAELHGEIIEKDTSQRKSPPTAQRKNLSISKKNSNEDMENGIEKIKPIPEAEESQNRSKQTEKDTNEKEMELSNREQENQDNFKEASQENEDEDMDDESEKDKSEEEVEPSVEEQEDDESSKEASQENEDEDMDDIAERDKSEEEVEPSAEEQEDNESCKEASQENEDEEMDDIAEKDKSEEEVQPRTREPDTQDSSKEASQDKDMDDTSEKDTESDQEIEQDQDSQNSSKEKSNENQDEDMEEMVWDDNDDEKSSDHAETEDNGNEKTSKVSIHGSSSKNISSKSLKTAGLSVREDQVEQESDVIDETPNNSHATTEKETSQVKSPEAVLQNITKDNESFRPIGRSTTFRKSKSVIFDNKNVRPSLPPVQESTLGSEGSRNSSTEGSEWDSHRTTRKTIRQTFGKGFTPRKSLRALVMEQSAKRQTEHYNKTTANMSKNKSVLPDVNDKNASKLNKTKNKTIVDDANKKDESKINKTKNKTVIEDVNERNATTINKTKNISVLEDVNDLHIRDRRVSNRNISSNQLSESKSLVHGTFTHHVSDPLISEPQVSYQESLQDIIEPEMTEQQISNRDASINMSEQANNDSGPEISIHASYGQSMSSEYSDRKSENHTPLDLEISHKENRSDKEISQHDASVHKKSMHVTSEEEILDYEASNQEQSEEEMSEPEEEMAEHEEEMSEPEVEMSEPEEEEHEQSSQENAEQENSVQELLEQSVQEEEKEDSEPEESENEIDPEESENEEQIEDESQQEEPESEQEKTQEVDAESEQESENEDHDMSQESVNDVSQHESDKESVQDMSEELEQEVSSEHEENNEDSDHFVSGLNSPPEMSNSNRTDRVVFDNEMSEQEIDYERSDRVSRQLTDNDISEEVSEREPTPEISRSRVSERSRTHDVSIGTKKSMLLMQMERIAQQNMEIRQKIREKVQNSLKTTRNFNKMSPIKSNFSIRRMNKSEPKKAKSKPKPTVVCADSLPRAFIQDLEYKPPKRFAPSSAPWITKRLYKFLETKLEPKYDYRARVRAEELVQTLHSFAKLVKRRDVAPQAAVDELKREMARLHVVNTHFQFYEFFHQFMPREIRVKVNPDLVNKIPMPRNGVFAEILQTCGAVA